jgi:plastocyanin
VIGAVAAAAALALSGTVAGASSTVSVKDDAFSPKSLTVSKGTKVTFKWKGSHPHDVHATGAAKFKTAIQTKGSYAFTFKKKGTVKLVCDVHPGMTGKIKVK